ncbi:MAG: septum formation initiator family protein [Oscillospiraceae bacterium]|nr:septum formation initiator family protein [Oscillospiraceae bacterium]
MLAKQKKKRRVGLLTKLAIVVFSVYTAVQLITLQVQKNELKRENTLKQEQVDAVKMKNTALSAIIDSEITEEMIKAQAREKLDLVEPGERVFVDISK